jgi:hypothetical protein
MHEPIANQPGQGAVQGPDGALSRALVQAFGIVAGLALLLPFIFMSMAKDTLAGPKNFPAAWQDAAGLVGLHFLITPFIVLAVIYAVSVAYYAARRKNALNAFSCSAGGAAVVLLIVATIMPMAKNGSSILVTSLLFVSAILFGFFHQTRSASDETPSSTRIVSLAFVAALAYSVFMADNAGLQLALDNITGQLSSLMNIDIRPKKYFKSGLFIATGLKLLAIFLVAKGTARQVVG